jgi:cytochrome c biogenesis protein CcmG/thiol:disulfide interchange protein DsbE
MASRASKAVSAVAFLLMFLLAPVSSKADNDVLPDSIATLASALGDSIPLDGRVVYVDFWASWCMPCRGSFPWMESLQKKYGERGLQVVTINVDADPAAGAKFVHEMKSSLPVIHDPKGTIAQRYKLEVMPTSFVYGRDGKLQFRHEGFRPKESAALESKIAALLQEKPTP